MNFYFKPQPGAFKNNLLRVSPDLLPPGSIRIANCWIDEQPYPHFDANGLTVTLPQSQTPVKVKVQIDPT